MQTIFILISLPWLLTKLLRFVALSQQKEYRWDRLQLFLSTSQGRFELWRLPRWSDLTRVGMKRPQVTVRSLVVLGLTLLLFGGCLWVVGQWSVGWLLAGLVGLYFLIPFVVFLATLPTAVLSFAITMGMLVRAGRLVKKYKPVIVGVTGSYGKTSTKQLIATVLGKKSKVFAPPRSFNTPYSLARSVAKDYRGEAIMVLEFAAYRKGEIARLARFFPPSLAVITGITQQHIGLFGSMRALMNAKAELVRALPEGAKVFVNGLDSMAVQVAKVRRDTVTVLYTGSRSIIKMDSQTIGKNGELSFVVGGKIVHTHLIGGHYAASVRAALAVGLEFGVSLPMMVEALAEYKPDKTFIQTTTLRDGALVIDDGRTSNPVGFRAMVKLAKDIVGRPKKILVFGGIVDLGVESRKIHLHLARKARPIFDRVIYVGEVGKRDFVQVFGTDVFDQKRGMALLAQPDKARLIVLEGFVPKQLYQGILGL